MSRKVIEPLIEHLRSTGTGEAKLLIVAETADVTKSPQEFVEAVREKLPAATVDKIELWLSANVPSFSKPAPASKTNDAALAAQRAELDRERAELNELRELLKTESDQLQAERKKLEDDKAALAAELEKAKK